jgi:hypothetical protein
MKASDKKMKLLDLAARLEALEGVVNRILAQTVVFKKRLDELELRLPVLLPFNPPGGGCTPVPTNPFPPAPFQPTPYYPPYNPTPTWPGVTVTCGPDATVGSAR